MKAVAIWLLVAVAAARASSAAASAASLPSVIQIVADGMVDSFLASRAFHGITHLVATVCWDCSSGRLGVMPWLSTRIQTRVSFPLFSVSLRPVVRLADLGFNDVWHLGENGQIEDNPLTYTPHINKLLSEGIALTAYHTYKVSTPCPKRGTPFNRARTIGSVAKSRAARSQHVSLTRNTHC